MILEEFPRGNIATDRSTREASEILRRIVVVRRGAAVALWQGQEDVDGLPAVRPARPVIAAFFPSAHALVRQGGGRASLSAGRGRFRPPGLAHQGVGARKFS